MVTMCEEHSGRDLRQLILQCRLRQTVRINKVRSPIAQHCQCSLRSQIGHAPRGRAVWERNLFSFGSAIDFVEEGERVPQTIQLRHYLFEIGFDSSDFCSLRVGYGDTHFLVAVSSERQRDKSVARILPRYGTVPAWRNRRLQGQFQSDLTG